MRGFLYVSIRLIKGWLKIIKVCFSYHALNIHFSKYVKYGKKHVKHMVLDSHVKRMFMQVKCTLP